MLSAVAVASIAALGFPASAVPANDFPNISNANIEVSFDPILRDHPFLMQEGGAMFLHLPGGTNVLFSIGMTDRRKTGKPTAEAMRQRRVAEEKAKKAIAESIHGIHVKIFVQTRETTVIQRKGDTEEVLEDLTEIFEKSESDVSEMILGLPVVGTWILKEDDTFCLAIGRLFPPSENGNSAIDE